MSDLLESLDQLIDATFLYPIVIVLLVGSAELGTWIGRRRRRTTSDKSEEMTTLTASALGLLALLLAFSLSHALSRHEARRALVLEEANAIRSTANFSSMLPNQAQTIQALLREYVAVRIGLGRPNDPTKLERDINKSKELLAQLWQQAVSVSQPQSLPAHRFVNSLDEMTKIQERRVISRQYDVPSAILFMMLGVAIVAMGFTGYQSGLTESHLRPATLMTAVTIAIVIVLVVDLDQPARGFIQVPVQALVDVAKEMRP
jgi:hypothetical protein